MSDKEKDLVPDLLSNLDTKIREKISEDWNKEHFGIMDKDVFDRLYKKAYKNITDFLLKQV